MFSSHNAHTYKERRELIRKILHRRSDVYHALKQSPYVAVCVWEFTFHEHTLSQSPAVLVTEAGNEISESFQIGVYGTSAMQSTYSFFILFDY